MDPFADFVRERQSADWHRAQIFSIRTTLTEKYRGSLNVSDLKAWRGAAATGCLPATFSTDSSCTSIHDSRLTCLSNQTTPSSTSYNALDFPISLHQRLTQLQRKFKPYTPILSKYQFKPASYSTNYESHVNFKHALQCEHIFLRELKWDRSITMNLTRWNVVQNSDIHPMWKLGGRMHFFTFLSGNGRLRICEDWRGPKGEAVRWVGTGVVGKGADCPHSPPVRWYVTDPGLLEVFLTFCLGPTKELATMVPTGTVNCIAGPRYFTASGVKYNNF